MQEKELSGPESLKLINRMIYEARGYYYETGINGLIYGFSILICTTFTYLREKEILLLPFHPFYIMVPIFFLQAFVQMKEEKKKKAKTFTDEAIDYVWLGFFIAVFAALCGVFANAGYIIISVILILTGFASFITGMLAKFKYHVYCGIICLVMAAVSFFIRNINIYFLLAAAAIMVWVIPGFILRAQFKKQNYGRHETVITDLI